MGAPAVSVVVYEDFPHTWMARVLTTPPLITPARQFTYPLHVPGEEDALQRGALLVEVKPAAGGTFLATAALGFREASLPSALYSCPRAEDLLILCGGYAYLVDTALPERCLHLPLRPVVEVLVVREEHLILLSGHWNVIAVDADGLRWQSKRVSAEGVHLERVEEGVLHGTGWSMVTDRDVPFAMDLRTGEHQGGGLTP